MKDVFVDTNIFLRYLTKDVPGQAERAKTFLHSAVESGTPRLFISEVVIMELQWTLERSYKLSLAEREAAMFPILQYTEQIYPAAGFDWPAVFSTERQYGIDFNDALHYHLMRQAEIDVIVSFDTDFDAIPDITRRES